MENCGQCPGEFRTIQGLRGHEYYVHSGVRSGGGRVAPLRPLDRLLARLRGNGRSAETPPSPAVPEERPLDRLRARMEGNADSGEAPAVGRETVFDRLRSRLDGNADSADATPVHAAGEEVTETVELSGLLDRLVDRVSGPLGEQVRRQVEDAVRPVVDELANLRRRLEALEGKRSELATFAKFVTEDVLPAVERRFDTKKDEAASILIVADEASMPPPWERAPCGHMAPPGSRTCDALVCIAGRVVVAGG